MRPLAAALLLWPLLIPADARAQARRWTEIGKTSTGNPVFVDRRSVRRVDGIVHATLRVRFLQPVKTPQGAWTSSRTMAMFDCARRTVAAKENIYYLDERAGRIADRRVVGQPGFGSPIKGTMPDVALQYLCRG